MLAKSPNYYADGENVKTVPAAATLSDRRIGTDRPRDYDEAAEGFGDGTSASRLQAGRAFGTSLGANPRDVLRIRLEDMTREELIELVQSMGDGEATDVLRISAEPLKAAHYAAFPTKLVDFCLRAAVSQRGYCGKCGMPWVRMMKKTQRPQVVASELDRYGNGTHGVHRKVGSVYQKWLEDNPDETLGWRASCSCAAGEPQPGVVLDPFCGSGRSGIAARRLGLRFIGVELNHLYSSLARRLIEEDLPMFNTLASEGEAEAGEAGSAGSPGSAGSLFDTLPADGPEGAEDAP